MDSAMSMVCLIPDPDIISPLNQIYTFNFPILILFYSYIREMSSIKAVCCWYECNVME